MPAAVIPFRSRAGSGIEAEYVVLHLAPAGEGLMPFGVMLLDQASGKLEWRLREDVDGLPLSAEDAEYAALLQTDFEARAGASGGKEFLESLEDSLSGFVRVSDRHTAAGASSGELLNRLFSKHVKAAEADGQVLHYVTHLPFYGLRAAATRFGEDMEVDEREEDVEWVRAPEGLRLSRDLFVVQVVGRSMEPLIPDGSLAIFRKFGAGSRSGKRVLIEELGASHTGGRFTVKRYTSVKDRVEGGEDGEWEHTRIRLEPLNPEFEAFDLDAETFENRYRVRGEFVAVLPSEA